MPHSLWKSTQWAIWKHVLLSCWPHQCKMPSTSPPSSLLPWWGGKGNLGDGWLPPWVGMVEQGTRGANGFFTCCWCSQSASNPPKRGGDPWNSCSQFLLPWKQAGLPGEGLLGGWYSSTTPFSSHIPQVALQDRRNIPGNWRLYLEDDNLCYPFPASPRIQSATPGRGRYVPPSPLISHTCLLNPPVTFVSSSRQTA